MYSVSCIQRPVYSSFSQRVKNEPLLKTGEITEVRTPSYFNEVIESSTLERNLNNDDV
ncbi:hypothetical protein [Methanosarcina mazei]|uniref:hypothetical protein n=1 Tax=Methanosarcina mazei TaxID=2209 RepID=UPI000A83B092|nr:hypothetical protein [Methanosarcina mazei]WIM47905.1 hypothetical protein PQQ20_06460 [Methanosarcina mazei]BBL66228.1 hypothetical protein MmazTMA_32050 [Methanosarcina mazei]